MMRNTLLAFFSVLTVVGIALAGDLPPSLSFAKVQDDVIVTGRATALMGPRYLKVTSWREANTQNIHLEYILIQNLSTCKKSPEKMEVKWNLKDTGVTWENYKDFTYHIEPQEVRLNTEDISQMVELLLPKEQKITR